MSRQSNNGIRSDDPPCCRRRQIVLPDVHPLGTSQPGDVGAVVDDEDSSSRRRQVVESAGKLKKRRPGERLGAKLNNPSAALKTGPRQIEWSPACSSSDIHVDYCVETVGR
jgi:hypothetical protein